MLDKLKRYFLLALAAVTLVLVFAVPSARAALRYVSVAGLIVAPFAGRAFVRAGDTRGWAFQNAALLVSAAALIAGGILQ